MIYLGIIEDQPTIREALTGYLDAQPGFRCVLSAGSVEEFLAAVPTMVHRPSLVLSDIGLPGLSGVEGLMPLRMLLPQTSVVMLSVHTDASRVFEALRAGAVGYLEKNTPLPLLKEHLLQIAAGGAPMSPSIARHVIRYFQPSLHPEAAPLTAHELGVVRGIEDGLSHQRIADQLQLSPGAVSALVRQVYGKLQSSSPAELATRGSRR